MVVLVYSLVHQGGGAGPHMFVNIIFKEKEREAFVFMLVLYLKYYTVLKFIFNVK